MERYKNLRLIRERIPEAAQYEQLAEECAELAHAALKAARILRGENPTPRGFDEVMANLREEYADVKTACDVLGLTPDYTIMGAKLRR